MNALAAFLEEYPEYSDTYIIDDYLNRPPAAQNPAAPNPAAPTPGAPTPAAPTPTAPTTAAPTLAPSPSSPDAFRTRLDVFSHKFLRLLGASEDEYRLIFTPSLIDALDLIARRSSHSGRLLLSPDAPIELERLAPPQGAEFIPIDPISLRWRTRAALDCLCREHPSPGGILAFSAQSPLSGVRAPLALVSAAQKQGWEVVLEASRFIAAAPLNLSRVHPDFVVFDWECLMPGAKLSALIAKRSAQLQIDAAPATQISAAPATQGVGAQALPCGDTPSPVAIYGAAPVAHFLSALEAGWNFLQEVSYRAISERTSCLARYLSAQLRNLRHPNGAPQVIIYGDFTQDEDHGPTLACNFLDAKERLINPRRLIDEEASAPRDALRTLEATEYIPEATSYAPPSASQAQNTAGIDNNETIAKRWICGDGGCPGLCSLALGRSGAAEAEMILVHLDARANFFTVQHLLEDMRRRLDSI